MSFILRRAKIVATLGPATDDPEVLDRHRARGRRCGAHQFLARRSSPITSAGSIWCVRRRARAGRYVGVLGDLQGPKIRVERFAAGKVQLADGAEFALDASLDGRRGR